MIECVIISPGRKSLFYLTEAESSDMHTEEVAANIYRIQVTLPNNPLKYLNSYLIKDPDGSLLIDTGFRMDECREDLLAGLAELGEEPGDVDIFLTHLHADHTGLAGEIVGEGKKMMIGRTDREWLTGEDISLKKWSRNVAKYLAAGFSEEEIGAMPTFSPAHVAGPLLTSEYVGVEEGYTISIAGYHLRCIETPGHTPGHMCLWDEEKRLMFTGDHVLFDITPNITVWGNMDDSLGYYLQSLNAVKRYPVLTALPGHRMPGDFAERIGELLRHHERRLAGIEDIIGKLPGLSGVEIAKRMKWKIRANSWEDFPEAQKIFAIGECLSHLEYLLREKRIKAEAEGKINRYYLS